MEKVNIKQVRSNPDNPRVIKNNKFEKLVKSIKEFPQMLELRPIVVNADMVVLGGNMRLRACEAAGLKEIPVMFADNLTEEQQKEFIVKDNVNFGEWDWDVIFNEWNVEELDDWGLTTFNGSQGDVLDKVNNTEDEEWVRMPDFEVKDSAFKIVVSFESEEDREQFAQMAKLKFSKKESKSWSTWWPYKERDDLKSLKYE